MKISRHLAVSAVLAAALFMVFRSGTMAVTALISGVLADLDHIFDYHREYGFRFDVKQFFHTFSNTLYTRVVLLFHGWEWVALLGIAAVITGFNPVITGLFFGIGSHVAADQMVNQFKWNGYFILFRISRKFVTSEIIPGKGLPVGKEKK